jgi:hypothetical protein
MWPALVMPTAVAFDTGRGIALLLRGCPAGGAHVSEDKALTSGSNDIGLAYLTFHSRHIGCVIIVGAGRQPEVRVDSGSDQKGGGSFNPVLVEMTNRLNNAPPDMREAFIYYTGHGDVDGAWLFSWPDKQTISYCFTPDDVRRMWRESEFRKRDGGARLIIISDSCHSGRWSALMEERNVIVLPSCGPNDLSLETHGVSQMTRTWALLNGCLVPSLLPRDASDPDLVACPMVLPKDCALPDNLSVLDVRLRWDISRERFTDRGIAFAPVVPRAAIRGLPTKPAAPSLSVCSCSMASKPIGFLRLNVVNSPKSAVLAADCQRIPMLRHPNILPTTGVCMQPFGLLIEQCAGIRTLAERLRTARTELTPLLRHRLVCEIASAVEFMHSVGYVHGHIDRKTICVDADEHARVGGIGVGQYRALIELIDTKSPPLHTAPELLPPTPVAAPTPACDVYSCGIVFAQILQCKVSRSIRSQQAHAELKSLDEPVRVVIERMIHTDPVKRPTAGEAKRKLSAAFSVALAAPPAHVQKQPKLRDTSTGTGLSK